MDYFKHETALVGVKAKIGHGTRIWAFSNVQDGATIGEHCNVADHCFIEKGVQIGDFVTIKNGVSIFEGVIIENDVFCGTNTVFINDRNPRSHRKDNWKMEKTIVKKGATIGSNATILCGIAIGEYAFVGAGSVVIKDVPSHAMVAGNPAKTIGFACSCGRKIDQNLQCECGLKYLKEQEGLIIDE